MYLLCYFLVHLYLIQCISAPNKSISNEEMRKIKLNSLTYIRFVFVILFTICILYSDFRIPLKPQDHKYSSFWMNRSRFQLPFFFMRLSWKHFMQLIAMICVLTEMDHSRPLHNHLRLPEVVILVQNEHEREKKNLSHHWKPNKTSIVPVLFIEMFVLCSQAVRIMYYFHLG